MAELTRKQIFEAVANGDMTAEEAMQVQPKTRGKIYVSPSGKGVLCISLGRRAPWNFYPVELLRLAQALPDALEFVAENSGSFSYKDNNPKDKVIPEIVKLRDAYKAAVELAQFGDEDISEALEAEEID